MLKQNCKFHVNKNFHNNAGHPVVREGNHTKEGSFLNVYFTVREHVSFLCHSYAEDSGKGKSECRFTLGQAYLNMGGTKGNNKIHYQLFTDDTNSTRLEEMLKEAGREARGKRAVHIAC